MIPSSREVLPPETTSNSMYTRRYRIRVYSHERGDFRRVRNSNVLIYWPHGFGDWVQLAYVLPFLEPTNRYWITRFGDDNTSVMEGHGQVAPIYVGVNSTHNDDGGAYHNRHFGIEYSDVLGEELELELPLTIYDQCREHAIDTMLWSSFPEPAGHVEFPFHSKARNLLRSLIDQEKLEKLDLGRPLRNSLSFDIAPWAKRWVESRLRNRAGFGGHRKLCVVGRNGYTSVGKNWGHLWREDLPFLKRREGEECRDFMRLMRRKDPNWMFLVMEDRLFGGDDTVRVSDLHAHSYAELFGTPDNSSLAFGIVMKAILNFAELFVGVPAGPYHLSMVTPDLPTIGIWTEHLPCWFDEPKRSAIHIVSRNVCDRGLEQRPGSFSSKEQLEFRTRWVNTRVITGEEVVSAAEELN